jgi:hypothetical protein
VANTKTLGDGISELGVKAQASAIKASVGQLSSTVAKAPQVSVSAGEPIAPVVKSLSKSSAFKVTLVINGKQVSVGTVRTNASGVLTLPALSASKPGTYLVQLTSTSGKKYFVKLVVKAKKK